MSAGLALLLGATQGFSELFPLSSLGILVILPHALHIPFRMSGAHYLPFVVALHVGTALALLLYFLGDWVRLVSGAYRSLTGHPNAQGRLLGRLVIATIPAGFVGYLFKAPLASLFALPVFSGILLLLNGLVLLLADTWHKRRPKKVQLADLSDRDALSVGLFQMFALFPGLSRSGLAMTGALRLGLSYEDAARFAFLLATPIIGLAGLVELPKLHHVHASGLLGPAILGGLAAGVVAFLSTHFLLRYFERGNLRIFAVFSMILGVLGLVLVG